MTTSSQLFDPIRKAWVADEPEERVRQGLIHYMTTDLAYPKELLIVEKALRQLFHVQGAEPLPPDRRLDLLCMARGIHPNHPMHPLLLVECKAVPLSEAAERQVIGYNRFVQAPFIALVNQTQLRTGWRNVESGEYEFISGLPSYADLLVRARI